jgi:hypothetical protein
MKAANGVRTALTGDGAILLDTHRGVMFDLNHVAALIWSELHRGSAEDIAHVLHDRFPTVPADTLLTDVRDLLSTLTARQLLLR